MADLDTKDNALIAKFTLGHLLHLLAYAKMNAFFKQRYL